VPRLGHTPDPDLLLLHAPSVYDFRERAILYGPVSDMVPSSTVFEMYPLGFLTIASYLHDRGMDVRIVNLALRMMQSRHFDVPAFLARQRPRAVGIDLHWLPHAHGALEVARIVKEVHPEVPVIFGGLSSSYFHEELIEYPQVDVVLRGDSTEPPLHELLVANVEAFARLTRGPIALIGDLRMAGESHASEVLERLHRSGITNEIIIELFGVPPPKFLRKVDRCLPHWSIEFSPESHDQAVRGAQEGEADYTTEQMEEMLVEALRLRCERLDVFFMIGLPGQSLDSVRGTVDYCERLFQLCDRRLSCFISPMGPFIDPGSRGFEQPERFGYRLFARTLEEHRRLLVQPTWEHILNYETRWMTRRELVDATYEAAERLNELKMKYGRIPARRGRAVAARIAAARALRERLESLLKSGGDPASDPALRGEISAFSMSTVCDKRELFTRPRISQFHFGEVLRILTRQFLRRPFR
jgi:radical SAM superfamily enzyme YgiQ (UPF0313 family)